MANLVARILAGLLLVLRRRHGGNEDSGRTRQTSTIYLSRSIRMIRGP